MGWFLSGAVFLLAFTIVSLLALSSGAPEWALPLFGWLMYLSARAIARDAE